LLLLLLLLLLLAPGLGELACHASQLDDGHATTKHHHHAHLQQHTVGVPAAAATQRRHTCMQVSRRKTVLGK
jgi:hypothetical protein